jgi:hypothetical protein
MKPMNALQQKYFMPMKLALHQMQSLDSVNPSRDMPEIITQHIATEFSMTVNLALHQIKMSGNP